METKTEKNDYPLLTQLARLLMNETGDDAVPDRAWELLENPASTERELRLLTPSERERLVFGDRIVVRKLTTRYSGLLDADHFLDAVVTELEKKKRT